jgi:uncharacterized spore protein YtfJ
MNITQQIQERFTAGIVYGDPVESNGAILLPAAYVVGGGGGGSDPNLGEGGGFGLVASPAGGWVIRDGEIRWKPAINPTVIIAGGYLVAIAYFFFASRCDRSKAKGRGA